MKKKVLALAAVLILAMICGGMVYADSKEYKVGCVFAVTGKAAGHCDTVRQVLAQTACQLAAVYPEAIRQHQHMHQTLMGQRQCQAFSGFVAFTRIGDIGARQLEAP